MRSLLLAFLLLLTAPSFADQPALIITEMKVHIVRIQVKETVSFDDAVESLKLRANQHNIKFVGVNQLYKEIEALTGKPAKRMEIFSFCDGLTAQQMLAANLNTIAFMPCRIAIVEEPDGKRWIISLMMEDAFIHGFQGEARKSAERIMSSLQDMMRAASAGDL